MGEDHTFWLWFAIMEPGVWTGIKRHMPYLVWKLAPWNTFWKVLFNICETSNNSCISIY